MSQPFPKKMKTEIEEDLKKKGVELIEGAEEDLMDENSRRDDFVDENEESSDEVEAGNAEESDEDGRNEEAEESDAGEAEYDEEDDANVEGVQKRIVHLDFNRDRGKKRVRLQTFEGEIYEIDEDIALKSPFIKELHEEQECMRMFSDVFGSNFGSIYGNGAYRNVEDLNKEKLTDWDKTYLDVSTQDLLDLLNVADYLQLKGLIDIISQKIADMAKGKNLEGIREIFELENDFTPEEEEQIRREIEIEQGAPFDP